MSAATWQAAGPAVILASASPTRARLLAAAGVDVTQRPAGVDEDAVKAALLGERAAPGDAAVALAELKARRVADRAGADDLVLGADQVLSCDGRWLDKPVDREEARLHLELLSGRRHELWTAVVAFRGGQRVWHHVSEARLWLRPSSPEFIERYLDAIGASALASVGAYQVEGPGAQLFARIEGDHFAIQGLPLLQVLEFLRVQGVLLR